jgi:hypothetical protein
MTAAWISLDLEPVPPRLARFADQLRADNPLTQAIPFKADRWRTGLDTCAHLEPALAACAAPGVVTRADLAAISRAVVAGETQPERLFVATMIWGFGTVGYGPYRTRIMLDNLGAGPHLAEVVALLAAGRLAEAYQHFRVRMCGPAFFTKFFYAVGLGAELEPLPLVLDSQVAISLRTLAADGAIDAALLVRGEPNVQHFPAGYTRYVALLNRWARELGCRPDAIEMLLFDPPPAFRDPTQA